MWNWLIKNRLAAFQRHYDYDVGYMRDLLDTDARAFFTFVRATKLSGYRKGLPRDAYHAARLTAIIAEDCGPCSQLCVAMALEEGVPAATIAAVVRADDAALSDDARLARRFAAAVIAHAPEADELRPEIERRWGKRAVVALAFAVVSSRLYPTLKYALGHGHACVRLQIAGETVAPYTRDAQALA